MPYEKRKAEVEDIVNYALCELMISNEEHTVHGGKEENKHGNTNHKK